MFEAYGNLAQAYLVTGQADRATNAACRALELNETPRARTMFAQCVAVGQFGGNASRYRRWLARALVEGWTLPRELTRTSIAVIKRGASIADAISRADAAWPHRLPPDELWQSGTIAALAHRAADDVFDGGMLGFCCSLARQCFINEYVFATTDAETAAVAQLRASL